MISGVAHTSRLLRCVRDGPGLAPDDSPLLLRSAGTQHIYALDWEAPFASIRPAGKNFCSAVQRFLVIAFSPVPTFDVPGPDFPFIECSNDVFAAINLELVERTFRVHACDVIND
jgi:hypothetical protein